MQQVDFYTVKKRMLSLLVATFFVLCALFCRLFYIQIVWGKNLQAKAADQWTRDLPLEAVRGDILDVNGNALAVSETVFDVYVRPNAVNDPENTARLSAACLQVAYDEIYAKVVKKGVSEVCLAKKVSSKTADALRSENLDGIYFSERSERQYVYGNLLTQVLGFVSSDGVGQSGLEAYYDKFLQGVDGQLLAETDLVGKQLDDTAQIYLPSQKGLNVALTVDCGVQTAVENVLDLLTYQYSPKTCSCIVLDVTDGAVLAMATKPGYDLNEVPRDNPQLLAAYSRNVLLCDVYEPGSTFKVLTAAACLEESALGNPDAFDEDYVFRNNSRTRIVDGTKISCWSNHANGKHSNQTLSAALNNSCNPIFTDIALSLKKDVFYKYLDLFGYGKATGIDFDGEQSGLLISQSSVRNADLARIGFGQSIAVTALQLCCATAAAVNGGILYSPRLVDHIEDDDGNVVYKNTPTARNRAISAATSAKMAAMLEDVVKNGSGKAAYIEGYRVGGKTGTAQKYENGKIAENKYVSSFVGFFPADSPKYLVLMLVDEPEGQSYGSVVAAPYAKLVLQAIISRFNLSPST